MGSEPTGRSRDWAPADRRKFDKPHQHSSGDDLEIALTAAEHLLAQANDDDRRAVVSRIIAVALIFVTASVLAGLVTVAAPGFAPSEVAALIAFAALAMTSTSLLLRLASRARTPFDPRKKQIAVELAGLVSEVYLEVAEREDWSYVRLQSTKLRLSTFPLAHRAAVRRRDLSPVPEDDGL